jgi:hypothetical protein
MKEFMSLDEKNININVYTNSSREIEKVIISAVGNNKEKTNEITIDAELTL